jgi:ABC-type lipoprotein release transport system permease subunit
MNFLAYIYRRLTLYWQVLLTLALGIMLAVTLLASGPVMVESILDFSLRRTLISSEPIEANLRLLTSIEPDASVFQTLDGNVQGIIHSRFRRYLGQIVLKGETRWSYPWLQGIASKDQRVNLSFYGLDDRILLGRVGFISGGWPEEVRPSENVIATVIGSSMAKVYGLEVGDRLPLSIDSTAEQPNIWIEVSGIIRPLDYGDAFWFGAYSPLRSQADARYQAQYNVLVPAQSFFDLAADFFPASDTQMVWHVLLSPDVIKIDDVPDIQEQLHAIVPELEALGLRLETGLSETVQGFAMRTEPVRVPLYLLISTVVLLALYYVLMVATLSLRQANREFAVLLSRGASTWQLTSVKLVEAVVICGVALLSGPGLAVVLMRGLILFGPLADTSQEYWVLQLPQAAWLAAVVGAVACLLSLFGPLPGAVRRSIVAYGQTLSRSDRLLWWQRYYLDVVLLLAGLILLWRLRIYGGILSESGAGPQVDWLLLLAPLALLLGTATIMLRVFPLLLQLMARLVSETPGLPSALALWQAARDPGHIARLVLLLTLAMALGSLSSGLNVALDRNEVDRAYYATGGDLRLLLTPEGQGSINQGTVSEAKFVAQSIPGVNSLTGVLRTTGSLQLTIENAHPTFDVLAVEPQALQKVSRFRRDFADRSVLSLLDQLDQAEAGELPAFQLPGHPIRIGMWLLAPFDGQLFVDPLVRSETVTLNELSLLVKLSTAQGEIITVQLSPENPAVPLKNGWQYFQGQLPSLTDSNYPVSLLSFWFRNREGASFYYTILPQLAIDGLTIMDGPTGEEITIGVFEAGGPNWAIMGPEINLTMDGRYPQAGEARLLLDFGLSEMDITSWMGFNLVEGTLALEGDGTSPPDTQALGLETQDENPIPLPGHPRQLGVWLVAPISGQFEVGAEIRRPVGDLETVDIEVRLRTQHGEVFSFPLQTKEKDPQTGYIQDQWQYFWTDLTNFSEDQYPLVLESFGLRIQDYAYLPRLALDDMTIIDTDGEGANVIQEFEGLSPPYWSLEPSRKVGYAKFDTRGRSGNALFLMFDDYGDLGELGWLSVYPVRERPSIPGVETDTEEFQEADGDKQDPIVPVLASPAFLAITQAEVGDRIGAWASSKSLILEVVDVVQYFPTMMEEKDAGFVITLRDVILPYLNRSDYLVYNVNEFFLSTEKGVSSPDLVNKIQSSAGLDLQILDAETLRQTIKADPLALGLRSVTSLGYLLTSVLSLVGFGTYFYMSVRQRRKMYGVLRAIGMSSAQIYGSLLLEQVVLILCGLALGTGLGVLLNQLTLPGLPISLGGQPPIPPFLAETDWPGVIRIYLTLTIAFLLSLGLATFSLSRARLHQVLRVDEE